MKDCYDCKHAGVEHPAGVAPLMERLKAQRLIKIFVGDAVEPYLVAETTLVNASEYFAKALKHESSMGGGAAETGALRFPADGDLKDTWEVLLYWLTTTQLPEEYTAQNDGDPTRHVVEPWIRTWVLADKYLVRELQDTLMLEMLRYFDGVFLALDWDEAPMVNEMLSISLVGSPLRRLVAEETVRSIYEYESEWSLKTEHLIASDGVTGLSASLLDAYHDYMKHNKTYARDHTKAPDAMFKAWGEYLVGDVPATQWLGEFSICQFARAQTKGTA